MRSFLVLSVLLSLCIAGYFVFSIEPQLAPLEAERDLIYGHEVIETGSQLAAVGACVVCHTASKGAKYAGGLGLPTPFGTIFSTNITPDKETGIGLWSLDAFKRSMKRGVDREGNHLYPAFPYDYFTRTTDTDLEAIYAYLMSLDPVTNQDKENSLKFPFSYRPLLAGWKLLFLDTAPFETDLALDDEENRGAYMASSLGHCGACHTPRNILGAVQTKHLYKGGDVEGWDAPPIGPFSISPLPWTLDNYANYLFDGWDEQHGIAGGPMTAVVDHLYDANEDDVYAMATWLSALSEPEYTIDPIEMFDVKSSLDWISTESSNNAQGKGAQIFEKNCSKCHKHRTSRTQPVSLGLTYAVNAKSPRNLINVILNGIDPPYSSANRRMEAVNLTDKEVVEVVHFVRNWFTDRPPWKISEGYVVELKKARIHK